jgi:large subunit ribosomal protein L29
MKAQDLRKKTLIELQKLAEELRKKITELMIDKSMGKLTKTHLLKITKKDLARVLTVISELTRKNTQ